MVSLGREQSESAHYNESPNMQITRAAWRSRTLRDHAQMLRLQTMRAKLIVSFLLLTLVPLAATGLYGQFFTREALSQQALERSSYQVHLQAESIVSALRQVQGDALYLGALRSLNMLRQQTTPQKVALWRAEVEQDLLVLASVRPMYHAIRLINIEGEEFIGVRADGEQVFIIDDLQTRANSAYFRHTLALPIGGMYISPFQMQDETTGAPYMNFAMRLPDGVLVIDFHAGWMLRALPQYPGADTWAMIDQDGRFLVYPQGFEPAQTTSDIDDMLTGSSGTVQTASSVYVYETIYPTGSPGISSHSESTANPSGTYWVIFRHTPTNILYASVDDFLRLAALFLFISLMIAIVMALVISRPLVNPVKRLAAMVTDFGHQGVVPALPQNLPHDEIGTLTRAFIDMARELEGKRQLEHRLIERLIHAQEEERKLVAFDLHDGLIQQLVGVRFYLSQFIDNYSTPETENGLSRSCAALTAAIVEGRRIIEGLRPAALDDLGITAAIEELARDTAAAAEWELTLNVEPLPREPEKTISVTLYRIVQEALNNARKHAHATRMSVSLHNGSGIFVTIEDNGIGFSPDSLVKDERGLGITTMRERASLIKGLCQIISQPGQGTRIEVYVPTAFGDTKHLKASTGSSAAPRIEGKH